jgi:hypothetical protein
MYSIEMEMEMDERARITSACGWGTSASCAVFLNAPGQWIPLEPLVPYGMVVYSEWQCKYCGSVHEIETRRCCQCGAPRDFLR